MKAFTLKLIAGILVATPFAIPSVCLANTTVVTTQSSRIAQFETRFLKGDYKLDPNLELVIEFKDGQDKVINFRLHPPLNIQISKTKSVPYRSISLDGEDELPTTPAANSQYQARKIAIEMLQDRYDNPVAAGRVLETSVGTPTMMNMRNQYIGFSLDYLLPIAIDSGYALQPVESTTVRLKKIASTDVAIEGIKFLRAFDVLKVKNLVFISTACGPYNNWDWSQAGKLMSVTAYKQSSVKCTNLYTTGQTPNSDEATLIKDVKQLGYRFDAKTLSWVNQ